MKLHLHPEGEKVVSTLGATMGLAIDSITLDSQDLRELLACDDGTMREWLQVIATRFVPAARIGK